MQIESHLAAICSHDTSWDIQEVIQNPRLDRSNFQGDVGHLGPHSYIRGEYFHEHNMGQFWCYGGYLAPPKMHVPERFKIMYTCAQGLFAAANIFSSLKLVYIFSVNPYLGPLQVIWHALLIAKVANLSFWPFSNHGGELVCASNIISSRCHWAW